jgi:hypothetical protein
MHLTSEQRAELEAGAQKILSKTALAKPNWGDILSEIVRTCTAGHDAANTVISAADYKIESRLAPPVHDVERNNACELC